MFGTVQILKTRKTPQKRLFYLRSYCRLLGVMLGLVCLLVCLLICLFVCLLIKSCLLGFPMKMHFLWISQSLCTQTCTSCARCNIFFNHPQNQKTRIKKTSGQRAAGEANRSPQPPLSSLPPPCRADRGIRVQAGGARADPPALPAAARRNGLLGWRIGGEGVGLAIWATNSNSLGLRGA